MTREIAIKIAELRMSGIGTMEISRRLKIKKATTGNWIKYFKTNGLNMPPLRTSTRGIVNELKSKHKEWFNGSKSLRKVR